MSASLLVFLVLAVFAASGASAGLDGAGKVAAEALRTSGRTDAFALFTRLGSWPAVTLVTVVVAGVLLWRGWWRGALFLVAAVAVGIVSYAGLKQLFERPRPDAAAAVTAAGGYAFPSGHATQAATLALALGVLAWPTRWRWPVAAVVGVFAALIGLSRVYLGVHWLVDVLAGWTLALAVVSAALLIVEALAGPIAAVDTSRGAIPGIRVIFLDWGNTLMVDHGQAGAMARWDEVAAVPGAEDALRRLRPRYRLIVATNADSSGAALVRAALARVGLDELIDDVVSSRDVGACKPEAAFYRAALARADAVLAGAVGPGTAEPAAAHPGAAEPSAPAPAPPLSQAHAVMVGDSYENDVAGAMAAGLRAVWLDPAGRPLPAGAAAPAARIASMAELPAAIAKLDAGSATRAGGGPSGADDRGALDEAAGDG